MQQGEIPQAPSPPNKPTTAQRDVATTSKGKLASAGVRAVGGHEVSWTLHTCLRELRKQQCTLSQANLHLEALPSPLWSCFPRIW